MKETSVNPRILFRSQMAHLVLENPLLDFTNISRLETNSHVFVFVFVSETSGSKLRKSEFLLVLGSEHLQINYTAFHSKASSSM